MASSRWASLSRRTNTGVAVLGEDGKHVGVKIGLAVAVAGQGHGESDEGIAVERSQHLAADTLRNDEDAAGDDIAVAVAPDFELEDDATLEVLEGSEGLDVDGWLRAGVHDLVGSVVAFFA